MISRNKSGSSMVSVIVAFLLLIMGIAMFTTVIMTATDVTQDAQDVRRVVDAATEKFYLDEKEEEKVILSEMKFKEQGSATTTGEFTINGQGWTCEMDHYLFYYFESK